MSDVANLQSVPAPAESLDRPKYLYPEDVSPAEQSEALRLLDVDGEAYLRWLAGEGADPCTAASSV